MICSGYQGDTVVDFSLPASEIDDALVLLSRLVAQARRDGVLPVSDVRQPSATEESEQTQL